MMILTRWNKTLGKSPLRSQEDKDDLWKIVNVWRGQTFGDITSSLIDEDTKNIIKSGLMTHGISNLSTMNHSPDYDNFVKRGYRYYIDDCKKKLEDHKINDIYDMEQEIAWESMIIVMEAIIDFAHRHADLAEKEAAACQDPKRKKELEVMAENCRVVPENPPRPSCRRHSLYGSHHLALTLEVAGGDHNLGRYDQYMLAFFQKENEEGRDEEYFADIIHELKLKVMEMWGIRGYAESIADPGCPSGCI